MVVVWEWSTRIAEVEVDCLIDFVCSVGFSNFFLGLVIISPMLVVLDSNPQKLMRIRKSKSPSSVPCGPPPGCCLALVVSPLNLTTMSLILQKTHHNV